MATKNLAENKRFVYRSPNRKRTTYLVPTNAFRSQVTPITKVLPSSSSQIVANSDIPRTIETPARRVVVVRNTKHAQINQGPVDLGDLGHTDSEKNLPIINNGNASVYFIRRPIAPSDPPKSVE